jgi:hypothetical protein
MLKTVSFGIEAFPHVTESLNSLLVFVRKNGGQICTSCTFLGVYFPRGDDECVGFARYYIIEGSITDFNSPLPATPDKNKFIFIEEKAYQNDIG